MKILITGSSSGKSGSWIMRAVQMGAALGATVKPRAGLTDMLAADAVLVIKRCDAELIAALRTSGRPWVYDVIDAYPQPGCRDWTQVQSIAWLRALVERLRPNVVIWPNERMRDDHGGGGTVVLHHHRPGIERNPVRERIKVVAYEGSPRYLDGLIPAIEMQCRNRGMRFVVNPPRLADVDVVMALRSPLWDSYATRHWKSAVKLVNAHASGTPFIGAAEAGYLEIAVGGERWAETPQQFGKALDGLAPQAVRQAVSESFLTAAFPVERAAAQMRDVLCALRS